METEHALGLVALCGAVQTGLILARLVSRHELVDLGSPDQEEAGDVPPAAG